MSRLNDADREQVARILFEFQRDKLGRRWADQWEPTREYWRAKVDEITAAISATPSAEPAQAVGEVLDRFSSAGGREVRWRNEDGNYDACWLPVGTKFYTHPAPAVPVEEARLRAALDAILGKCIFRSEGIARDVCQIVEHALGASHDK